MNSLTPRLAVAFDFNSRDEVFAMAEKLAGLPIVIKLGLGVLPYLERKDFLELKARAFDLFIDVKLHDIPSQVARAVATWAAFGARYITLHTSGASQMIAEAVKAVSPEQCTLLGVTVLTSMAPSHCAEIGWQRAPHEQVKRLLEVGIESGLRGFVSPASDVPMIKAIAHTKNIQLVSCTPGLKILDDEKQFDQPNALSVKQALANGADLLVLGRSIIKAQNPRAQTETALAFFRTPT